jgi:plastocyanin
MLRRLVIPLLLAISVAACDDSPTAPDPAPAGATTITIVSGASALSTTAFSPNPITVPVGTQVSFLNGDNVNHTSFANAAGVWSSPIIAPGKRFNVTLTTAGSYPYHCTLHAGMVGTVNVQ